MRIVRFGEPGRERPGVLTSEGRLLDATPLVADWSAEHLDPTSLTSVSESLDKLSQVDAEAVRLGPPIAPSGEDRVHRSQLRRSRGRVRAPFPTEPVVFMKDPSTVVGPNDFGPCPATSTKTDFEVELAVVIGRTPRYLDRVRGALAVRRRLRDPTTSPSESSSSSAAGSGTRARPARPSTRWDPGWSPPTRCPDPQALASAARSTARRSTAPPPT